MHVGLVGARGWGRHHLQAFQNSPHVETVSLAGRDRAALEALQERFPKVRALFTDYQELLEDPGVDLLDVVLPHHLHLPVALAAFARGKHVLMEKPPTRTPAEFQEMIAAAERAERRLFVVMNLLFSPVHHAVREVVDSGALGTPCLSLEINVANHRALYLDPHNWRAERERCGGGLQTDGGFHGVYRQLYFLERLGSPVSVTAECAQIGVHAPGKGEDFAALTLAYESGARVHLMNHWTAPAGLGRFPSGIVGTEGALLFTGDPAHPLLLRRADGSERSIPVPPGPAGFAETVVACVEHYLHCLALGAEPWVGLDLPLRTLEIIHGAYEAGGAGCRQRLEGGFRTCFPADRRAEGSGDS